MRVRGENWKGEDGRKEGSDQERPSLPQTRLVPEPSIATSALVLYWNNPTVPHNTPRRLSRRLHADPTYYMNTSVSQNVRVRAHMKMCIFRFSLYHV